MTEDKKVVQILQEMGELPPLLPQCDVESMKRSIFDPWYLRIDPRVFDSYGQIEERKTPQLKAPLELSMPAFFHFKQLQAIDDGEQKLITTTTELEFQKQQFITVKAELELYKQQLYEVQTQLVSNQKKINQLQQYILEINKSRQALAEERVQIIVEKKILVREKKALAHKKYNLNSLNRDAFRDGFISGTRLYITLLKINESRVRDEEQFKRRLVIIEKENLASRNSNLLLKSSRKSKKSRWGRVISAESSSDFNSTNDSLCNDKEIVEGPEEDDKKKKAALPTASLDEIAVASTSSSSNSRVSRVTELNKCHVSTLRYDELSNQDVSNTRHPLADVGNTHRVIKLIDPLRSDPEKKKKKKKMMKKRV